MRVGIFGGCFNPPHEGHRKLLVSSIRELKLDRVFVVPTKKPPHKKILEFYGSSAIRLKKIKEFFSMDNVEVSLIEWKNSPSYTFKTLSYYKKKLPDADFYIIIGSDEFINIRNWKNWKYIILNAKLVVGKRPGYPIKKFKGVHILKGRFPEISSTAIRSEANL